MQLIYISFAKHHRHPHDAYHLLKCTYFYLHVLNHFFRTPSVLTTLSKTGLLRVNLVVAIKVLVYMLYTNNVA